MEQKKLIYLEEKKENIENPERNFVWREKLTRKNIALSHFPSIVTSPLSTQELGVDILPSLSETALPMLATYLSTSSVGFIFRVLSEC